MPVCYLLMTHQAPAQIARLVGSILRGSRDGWILLLHDREGCSLTGVAGLDDPRVEVLSSPVAVRRGDFSMVEAFLHALRWLQASQRSWDWVIYLSGQDYPLRPLHEVEEARTSGPFDAYLHHWEVGGKNDQWRKHQGRIRYHYRYRELPQWTRPLLRAIKWTHSLQNTWRVFLTYSPRFGLRVRELPFGPALRLHGGSQWADLSRPCVDYLLDFCQRHPRVIDHFRTSAVPDEGLVPTVFANAGRFRIANDNRRYIDWSESREGRPRTLTCVDLPAMCASDKDFARKFDERADAAVLDAIDARIAAAALPGQRGAQAGVQRASPAGSG